MLCVGGGAVLAAGAKLGAGRAEQYHEDGLSVACQARFKNSQLTRDRPEPPVLEVSPSLACCRNMEPLQAP